MSIRHSKAERKLSRQKDERFIDEILPSKTIFSRLRHHIEQFHVLCIGTSLP